VRMTRRRPSTRQVVSSASPAALHVAIDERGVVYLFGELDQTGVWILHERVNRDDALRPLQIDASAVTFIDSAGLSALLRLAIEEEKVMRRVTLANPPAVVIRLLELSGTASRFDLAPPDRLVEASAVEATANYQRDRARGA
jgi:anti-anti-sigma factor